MKVAMEDGNNLSKTIYQKISILHSGFSKQTVNVSLGWYKGLLQRFSHILWQIVGVGPEFSMHRKPLFFLRKWVCIVVVVSGFFWKANKCFEALAPCWEHALYTNNAVHVLCWCHTDPQSLFLPLKHVGLWMSWIEHRTSASTAIVPRNQQQSQKPLSNLHFKAILSVLLLVYFHLGTK